jgi:hypothetical protein
MEASGAARSYVNTCDVANMMMPATAYAERALFCSICSIEKRGVIQTLQGHAAAVSECCFDQSCANLITCSATDGCIHFWNLAKICGVADAQIGTAPSSILQSAPSLDVNKVLVDLESEVCDWRPIPSSFSPGKGSTGRSQRRCLESAMSLPAWGPGQSKGGYGAGLAGEEPVSRSSFVSDSQDLIATLRAGLGGRLSMAALRTSLLLNGDVRMEELRRRRAADHLQWSRAQLDHLDAMQQELKVGFSIFLSSEHVKSSRVCVVCVCVRSFRQICFQCKHFVQGNAIRRSLTHVPMNTRKPSAKRPEKLQLPTIASVSELQPTQGASSFELECLEHDSSQQCLDRRASAPACSPHPVDAAELSGTSVAEFQLSRPDDSLSSLTMPSPNTMVRTWHHCGSKLLSAQP